MERYAQESKRAGGSQSARGSGDMPSRVAPPPAPARTFNSISAHFCTISTAVAGGGMLTFAAPPISPSMPGFNIAPVSTRDAVVFGGERPGARSPEPQYVRSRPRTTPRICTSAAGTSIGSMAAFAGTSLTCAPRR